jgi:hypothetical protein
LWDRGAPIPDGEKDAIAVHVAREVTAARRMLDEIRHQLARGEHDAFDHLGCHLPTQALSHLGSGLAR